MFEYTCINIFIYIIYFRAFSVFFPCFFLSCKANARVYRAKNRARSALFLISEMCCSMYCLCRLCFSVYCLCRLCCSVYCLCRLCCSVYCLCRLCCSMYCLCRLCCSMYCLCQLCCSMYCLCQLCCSVYCFVFKCVLNYCHQVSPQLQLNICHIMSLYVGDRLVCRFGSNQTCTLDGHLNRVTYTRCRINTTDSPDDEHRGARNM